MVNTYTLLVTANHIAAIINIPTATPSAKTAPGVAKNVMNARPSKLLIQLHSTD